MQDALVGMKCIVLRGFLASQALTFGWVWAASSSATAGNSTGGRPWATC